MTELHTFLTADMLRETLQAAGYRVTETQGPDKAPVLISATNGLPFEVRLLNPLPKEAGAGTPAGGIFADAAFRAAFRVQGELPLALVNTWNVTHRFARLILAGIPDATDHLLILEMDLVVLGGAAPANLRAHVDIWDRLVTELVGWLRAELPRLAKAAPVAEPQAAPVSGAPAGTELVPAPSPETAAAAA
jgi:hypothetical protein